MTTGTKRGKECQPVLGKHENWLLSAGKHDHRSQAREHMTTGATRGKTCQRVLSAGKYDTSCKCGKT